MCVKGLRYKRDLFPHLITTQNDVLLKHVSLLNIYEDANSLKGKIELFLHLIHHWDHGRKGFIVGLYERYQPIEGYFYFIFMLARMWEYFLDLHDLLYAIVGER